MENKKAVNCLSNAFRGLRSAQVISSLNWFHSYISGATSALACTGCITNSEGTKILERSNAIYNERRKELVK